ncbi:MAG: DUF4215 domain-containing protein [Candidatus Altimarinota bacterium]
MLALPFLFFENGYAQPIGSGSGNADISVSVSTPPPQLSISSPAAGQLEVHWNWDFISASYYPPPITEIRVEISSDGLNYGNLQTYAFPPPPATPSSAFMVSYSGLAAGTYTAQVMVVDGNDYDYVVGPVNVSGTSGGDGGGRSRGDDVPIQITNLTLNGFAYPGPSTVVIFTYEGGFETSIDPISTGAFSYSTSSLPPGEGTFSFSAKDPNNVLSAPVTFDYDLQPNSFETINDIRLPPTVRISSSVVSQGEVLTVNGYGYANGSVSLDVDGPSSRAYLVQIGSSGAWLVNIDTSVLTPGTYNVVAQTSSIGAGFTSPLSETLVFELVPVAPAAPVCGNGIVESPEQCDDGNLFSGDGCSTLCLLESGLPQSSIDQPSPTIFTSQPIDLTYTAVSPNGAIDLIEVFYSRNGGPYVAYPASFISGTIQLTGLQDGEYEVYSIAHDSTGAIEPAPAVADATFEIDQVAAFNVIAYPEKRSPPQGNWSLPSRLRLYVPGNLVAAETFDFTTDSQGRFEVDAVDVLPGNYHFLLKGLSHLSRRLSDVSFQGADVLLDYTVGGTSFLLGGDVHPSKDDYVNGLDLSSIVARLYGAFLDADLNYDGIVNGMDLSITVGNLFKSGEGV